MRKLILAACALTCAASVFAQGTVIFNNRVVGTVVTHVYAPSTANPNLLQTGNGTGDTVAGTTDWTGWTALSGTGYTAQLWSANGANQPVDSLAAASPTTNFRTGAAAGFINGLTATLPNVAENGTATLQLRVWDNAGGTITSYANAVTRGSSPLFNVSAIGGILTPAPALAGLSSFNIAPVPEPSTFALAGLGAAALLIFRRRK